MGSPHRTPVSQALKTLEAHLPDIHTVEDWARIHGYSRPAFARLVRAHFGRTPGSILRALRLERAQHILTTENEKLHEVALRVGLSSAGALNHFINVSLGIPPSQWREHLRMELQQVGIS